MQDSPALVVVVRRGRGPFDGDLGPSGGRQRIQPPRYHARDASVNVEHHNEGQEKGAHRRKHHVAPVPVIATRFVSVSTLLIPANQIGFLQ